MLVAAGSAAPSQLLVRNAANVRLTVSARGVATLSYTTRGVRRHAIAWGARDALAPRQTRPQVRFRVDYTGGWGAFGRPGLAGTRRVPSVPRAGASVARGRVHGARRIVLGGTAMAAAHFDEGQRGNVRAPPVALDRKTRRRSRSASIRAPTGTSSSAGTASAACPSTAFGRTRRGEPLDPYGRNIYVDTYDSVYGSGWHRENGFLARRPAGLFCYVLDQVEGKGTKYRATALGPGVTPIVEWVGRPEPGAGLGLTGLLADALGLCG